MRALLHPMEWRQAATRLLRAPGFSLTVGGLLTVALASTLTLAAAASALLLRPLPYPAGERLVEIAGHSGTMGVSLGFAPGLLAVIEELPQVERVQSWDHARAVEGGGDALLPTALVEAGLLESLGARALHGRLLQDSDAGTDAVLLSESAWRARHGADPGVVGERVAFGGAEYRIAGVVADGFHFPNRNTALWRPLDVAAARSEGAYDWGRVQALVTLKPGASIAALGEAVDARILPLPEVAPMREFMQLSLRVQPLRDRWVGDARGALAVAGAAVLLVLLLLVANLSGLWLERSLRRRRELAIRGALGATPARIAAGLAAEAALLCAVAVLAALALVPTGVAVLGWLGLLDAGLPWDVAPDARVLLAAAALGTLLAALLSLAPLAVARRTGATDLSAGARALALGPASERTRRGLVVVQVALAVTLLAGAALLGRSMLAVLGEDPGFATEGLLMLQLEPAPHRDRLEAAAVVEFHARAAALPGVTGLAYSNAAPFSQSEVVSSYTDPAAPERPFSARDRSVDPGWFATVGQPILRGRGFAPSDAGADVLVVDQRFARQLFGTDEVLGRIVGLPAPPGQPWRPARIVGVAADVRHHRLDEAPGQGTAYRPAASANGRHTSLLLRTAGADAGLDQQLRAEATALGLRISALRSASAALRESVADRTPLLAIALGFALVGTLLAAVGLFALVAFAVERRAGEFGLRLALGASAGALGRLALRDAARIAFPGLLLGIAGALLVGRLLTARLHGVSAHDPFTLAAVLAAVAACLLLATALPAWRAVRSDPIVSLRCE